MAEVWSAAWEYVGGDSSAIRGERRRASVAVSVGGGGATGAEGVVVGASVGVWVAVGPCVGVTGGQCVLGAVLIGMFLR
jgi:hypothetical protein